MLREFIRNRESIKVSRKYLDPICKRLEGVLRRASITIKERLTKKYVKTTNKEIMEAIAQNRHLIFEKNDKFKKNMKYDSPGLGVSPVKIEHVSPNKIKRHIENFKMEYNEDNIYFDSET